MEPEELNGLENNAAGKAPVATGSPSPEEPDLYKEEPAGGTSHGTSMVVSNIKKFGKKKLLAGSVGMVFGIGIIIIVLLMLMSLLKVPNYAANIALFRLARSAEDYAKSTSEIDAEKVAVDEASANAGDQAALASLEGTQTWTKLNELDPPTVYKNLDSTDNITYTKAGGEIKYVVLDDQSEPIDKFGNLFNNYGDRMKFSEDIDSNVTTALKTYGTEIRSSTAYDIRATDGISLIWYPDKGTDYNGLDADAADLLEHQQDVQDIQTESTTEPVTDQLATAVKKMDQDIETCDGNTECALTEARGSEPPQLSEDLTNDLNVSTGESVLNKISPLSIVFGLCLIYDGSMDHSGSNINAQMASASKSFYALESAADQQKAGDVTGTAVGAFQRKLGTGDSIPDEYMENKPINTAVEKSPESNNMGDFTSLANLIPNRTIVNAINSTAPTLCKLLTSPEASIGVLFWVLINLFTGGSEAGEAGEETLAEVVDTATTTVEKDVVDEGLVAISEQGQTTLKDQVFGFGKKFIRDFIGVSSATIAAKLVVLSYTARINNGSNSANGDFKDQADMGADVQNNELERQMYYGAPMTDKNVAVADQGSLAYLNDQEKNQPVLDRYFAMSDPRSLVSQISYQIASIRNLKISGLLYNLISKVNLASLGNILTLGITNRFVLADADDTSATSHYGIVQWGWTAEEYNLIAGDASYGVLENAKILEDSGQINNIEAKYDICFTDSMGDLLANGDIQRTADGDVVANGNGERCSPDNLGPDNNSFGPSMVFRWRLYEERNAVLDQNIGIQKPTTNNQIMVYQANNKNVSILGNSLIKRLSISENYPLSGGVHPIVTGYKTRAELVVGALGSTPLS